MLIKKTLYIFFIIVNACYAQGSFKPIATIELGADFITTDNQNNVYIVVGQELSKYNKAGKLLYKYSNKNMGAISFVDPSNLLKPMLFYKNFLQIVYLDNTLSANGDPVALDKTEYRQTQLACASYGNGIWVYDQQNLELVRINQNLEKTVNTGNLSVILNIQLNPNYIIEYNNRVYLNNPETGILVFDIYGTYYKTIPLKNVLHFQPIGEWIYYMVEANKIEAYHLRTTEQKVFDIEEKEFIDFRLESDLLLLKTSNLVKLYGRIK
jgi:hypothetical protein